MDRKTIEALVADNRLRKVNPSASRAEILIGRARKDLAVAPKIAEASEEIAYTAAYGAMFKATLAFLAVRGLRLGTTEQRKVAVLFLKAALPAALDPVLSAYDKMRQRRNDLAYDAGLAVSRKDADEAIKQATLLIDAIGKEIDPAIAEAKSKKKPV